MVESVPATGGLGSQSPRIVVRSTVWPMPKPMPGKAVVAMVATRDYRLVRVREIAVLDQGIAA